LISLSGSGLACTANTALVFTSPASGAAGVASINGASQVLTVSFTTGTFAAGTPISFSFGGVTNPVAFQSAVSNISSVILSGGVIQGASTTGFYPAIVDSIFLELSITSSPKVNFSSLKFSTGIVQPYPRISAMAPLVFVSPAHGCSGTANITTVANELTLVLEMTSANMFTTNSMIQMKIGLAPGVPASALLLCSIQECRTDILVDGREHYDYGIYLLP
jgi:hypothetical protein